MYVVIFKAKMREVDEEYHLSAKRMRELAFERYNCLDFTSVCEDDNEVSISYWESEDDIKAWKENEEHLRAQELGRKKWYESYTVEIVKTLDKKTWKLKNETAI